MRTRSYLREQVYAQLAFFQNGTSFVFPSSDPPTDFSRAKHAAVGVIPLTERQSPDLERDQKYQKYQKY